MFATITPAPANKLSISNVAKFPTEKKRQITICDTAVLRGTLRFSVLRFWLFFLDRFFGFGVHCGLRIFRFLASGFRFW